MSEISTSDAPHDGDRKPSPNAEEAILHTKPTIKPTIVLMLVVIFTAAVVVGILLTSPLSDRFGDTFDRLALNTVGVITALILLRLIIRTIVLRRTTYLIRTDSLERETDLILTYNSRKAPVDQLRGFEYSQNMIQSLLGYGSIRLLTAGTNQSLGFLVFENLPNAGEAKRHLEQLIK